MTWFPDPDSGDEGKLLTTLKKEIKKGEKGAILAALFVYLEHGLPPPAWLAQAFVDVYQRFLDFEVKSLDEIFGGHGKGTQVAAIRRQLQIRPEVFHRVNELRKERCSGRKGRNNDDVFAAVGKEFGISSSLAQKLYYQARKNLRTMRG
jgi:hypothetical protein